MTPEFETRMSISPGLLDGGVDAGLVGHVQAQPLVDVKAVQCARIPRGGDHAVAALGQFDGGGSTDALGGTRDQDRGHSSGYSLLLKVLVRCRYRHG